MIVTIAGCGSTPVVATPTPTSSAAQAALSTGAPASPVDARFRAYLDALASAAVPTADRTVRRDALLMDMGIAESLGGDAAAILDLARTTELAVQPATSTLPGAGSQIVLARAVLALPPVPSMPVSITAREYLASATDAVGRPGAGTVHVGPAIAVAASNEGGQTSNVQVTTTLDVGVAGSKVSVTIQKNTHATVSDSTGAPVFDETRAHKLVAKIDVCPTPAGIVDGSVDNVLTSAANAYPGSGGRVGSTATASATSTSTFAGHVDDSAVLGNVTQDYAHSEEFKRTASANGGPQASREGQFTFSESGVNDGVPVGGDWSLKIGDHSASTGKVDGSGDVTASMIVATAFSEADDYATVNLAYVASQKLWRTNRCVMVTSPTYNVESELVPSGLPAHSEDVDQGSSTPFDAGLKHRFEAPLTASIKAELISGKEKLTPGAIQKPPGTLTYEAPSEDGKDALVKLTSTSRQGIGTLVLLFHTGGQKLKVSIVGTMVTAGFGVSYTTKVTVKDLQLERLPDGSYAGTAPATAEIQLRIADCPRPYVQHGTLRLTATREKVEDPSLPARWLVKWDPATQFSGTGACLGVPLDSFTGPTGPVAGFMTVLGDLVFAAAGDQEHILRSKAIGPSTNKLDANVTGEIVSGSGP